MMGASGNNGTDGADGMDGSPGEAGQKGDQGLQGQKGERGSNGASGMKGQKGQMGSTASVTHGGVYTRWGYTSCGSSSSRLYYGEFSYKSSLRIKNDKMSYLKISSVESHGQKLL